MSENRAARAYQSDNVPRSRLRHVRTRSMQREFREMMLSYRCKLFAIVVLIEGVDKIHQFINHSIWDTDLPLTLPTAAGRDCIQLLQISGMCGTHQGDSGVQRNKDSLSGTNGPLFGRHGDIKPENILWFECSEHANGN